MIAIFLAIAIAFAAGCTAVHATGRPVRRAEFAGEAWLLGIAICAGALFILAIIGVRWSLLSVLVVVAVVVAALAAIGMRRGRSAAPAGRGTWISAAFDALTGVTIAGYTVLATAGPIAEIDFVAAWGLKARTFAVARGFDWAFLENPWYRWIHPDYPPLLPLAFDWTQLFREQWDDQWIGALYPCFALAVLLIVRTLLDEELGSAAYAAFATFALAPLAAAPWIGIAEGPLLAYATAGVLLLRRAMRDPSRSIEYASVFLGCAAATKNEGLALLIAAAMAMCTVDRGRRNVWRLWPAALIAAPWLVVRSIHRLPTDLASSDPLGRIVENALHPGVLFGAIFQQTRGHWLFLLGFAIAIALSFRKVREERFALLTIVLVLLFDMIASLASTHGVAWIVQWSWERLLVQVALIAGALAAILLFGAWAPPAPVTDDSGR